MSARLVELGILLDDLPGFLDQTLPILRAVQSLQLVQCCLKHLRRPRKRFAIHREDLFELARHVGRMLEAILGLFGHRALENILDLLRDILLPLDDGHRLLVDDVIKNGGRRFSQKTDARR